MTFWSDRKVLVTGGAGFIGSHLTERLVAEGAHVRVVDDLSRGRLENLTGCLSTIEFLQGDLRDREMALQACADREVIFHLASRVGGISYYQSRPAEVLAHNLLLDAQLWQAAEAGGVQRYLYASSAHIYPQELQGQPDSPSLLEGHALPAHPPLAYGWGKLIGERLLEFAVKEGTATRIAILRLIGVYGPRQDLDLASGSAIPVFIRRALEWSQTPFLLLTSGEETRSYCYVSDAVEAMLLALERLDQQPLLGPLNIGPQERISIRRLAEVIIELSGKPIEIGCALSGEALIWGQALDCASAREVLGWSPRVTLREGLAATFADVSERLAPWPGRQTKAMVR